MATDQVIGPRVGLSATKALLVVPTVLLIVSMGGQLLLPILLPLHHWAAKSASRAGRVGWALPAGVAGGTYAWLVVYQAAGEPQPAIWLAPLLVAVIATALMWRFNRPDTAL
jgi:hypothetical protein